MSDVKFEIKPLYINKPMLLVTKHPYNNQILIYIDTTRVASSGRE